MTRILASARLVLATSLSAIHPLILVIGSVLLFPFPRLRARWRMFIFRSWSRMILPVLGVEVEVEGTPPEPPFFLVCNHLSYLDIPVLGNQVGAVFIAKSEIAAWPGVGLMCKAVNTIFVDRNMRRDLPRVMREIDRELDNGMGVVLFAEGTSSGGATVLPFRPSLLEPAARSGTPVCYAALSYRTPEGEQPAHLAVCWWGGMDFLPHARNLATLRGIQAKIVFGDELIQDRDRKQLAEKLRTAMLRRFEPVVNEEE